MTSSYDVPILVILFNRPKMVAGVMESVRSVRPIRLYVAGDGPREGRHEEALCQEARKMATVVDWPCEVICLFQESNLGCKMGVATAINWFFSHEPLGIILEDDLVPSRTFYPFMREMLHRYAQSPEIGMVNGCCPWPVQSSIRESYHFSSYTKPWGWATWADRWVRHFDVTAQRYKACIPDVYRQFPLTRRFRRWWWSELRLTVEYGLDTWDYQWQLAHYANRLLVIRPRSNLVANRGDGRDATHTFTVDRACVATQDIALPLVHPRSICWDRKADVRLERAHVSAWMGGGMARRLMTLPLRLTRKALRIAGVLPGAPAAPDHDSALVRIHRGHRENPFFGSTFDRL